ncbi:T9SS type A sorting domain-containing protein [Ferruginibacter sp. SUN002]|uniref:T9SS type A sorting domain-containing protein n=1 Tax=Ferruginibacter sp. SUN002 TaxID=2937789 RepID=UPI003D35DE9E
MLKKLPIILSLTAFSLFSGPLKAQNGSDEPCGAPTLTVNPLGSACSTIVSATINDVPNHTYTNSISGSAGVTLPAVDCNFFDETTNDWWYKIVVPASGYLSVDLTENSNSTYFDWVMYTASSTTCTGSVFTEIIHSNQCIPDGEVPVTTGIGPLIPGTVVYLRMWREADYTQDAIRDYELCVNEAGPPPTDCPTPIAPANNSTIGAFPATFTWSTVGDALSYGIYLKDVTNGGAFEYVGSVIGTSASLGGGLSYSTTYQWYVVPLNAAGIGNYSCNTTYTFKTPGPPPAATCATATQICSPFSFSSGVDQPEDGGGVNTDYGCLSTAPNPEYHWVKITSNGNIRWHIESTPDALQDVDYAIWGPFTGIIPTIPTCGIATSGGNGFACGSSLGAPKVCDYSTDNGGDVIINNAKAGEYYVILVTNFENTPSTITITNNSGSTAGIECPCLVNELTIIPNADCNNNIYSVDYEVLFNNPPATGTLTITDGEGHTATINAPFTTSKTGTITGLTADGGFHTFTANFSANSNCKLCTSYTAPDPAPVNNSCAVGLPLSANQSAGSASGYTNNCTGKSVGEANYCGSPACRSVFYKIHTSAAAVDNALSIDIDGGNAGDEFDFCPAGIRVSVLTDCNTAAAITPSNCQTVTASTASLTFNGLSLNTDYYIIVDQADCADESCNWSMRFLGVGVLPVTMGSFEVLKMNRFNTLKWLTVNEQKTDHFEILRSENGVDYTVIANLTAANVRNGHAYSFNDDNRKEGINYYKIRTVNKDATSELSEIRKVNNTAATFGLSIAPNPAKDDIAVTVNNAAKGEGKFIITDGIGRKLAVRDVKLNAGKNNFTFNVSTFKAGVLYIKFIDSDGVTVTQPINKL